MTQYQYVIYWTTCFGSIKSHLQVETLRTSGIKTQQFEMRADGIPLRQVKLVCLIVILSFQTMCEIKRL
jgi:hypothetical protein